MIRRVHKVKYLTIPTMVGIVIPVVIHLLTWRIYILPFYIWMVIVGCLLLLIGIVLTAWSAWVIYGELGAPLWDRPPNRLITTKPYQYVRNPMALGMYITLLSESLLLSSIFVLAWATFFMVLSHVLVVQVEEPSLLRTFGGSYAKYCCYTARWLPILSRKKREEKFILSGKVKEYKE
ncbi:methyltransferase family protein [Paenibacillus sp. NPDC055715]